MATTLIRNGAVAGAMGAALAGRPEVATDPAAAAYVTIANAADAFASRFITANAALTVPMADADNASIEYLIAHVCAACLQGRPIVSATTTDYATVAAGAAAAAKAAVGKLT